VCTFIRKHYVPARALFVLTGNVDRGQVDEAVTRWLRKIPARPAPAVVDVPLVEPPPFDDVIELAVAEAPLYLVWPLPASYTAEGTRADLVFHMLYTRVEELAAKSDAVSDVGMFVIGGHRARAVVLALTLWDPDEPEEARALVRRAAADVFDDLDSPTLFAYRNGFLQQVYARLGPLAGRTGVLADYVQFDPSLRLLDGDIERLGFVAPRQTKRDARTLLDVDRALSLAVTPAPSAPSKYPRAALAYDARGHAQIPWKPYVDAEDASRPLTMDAADSLLGHVRRFWLENGLQVVLLPTDWVPLVEMNVVFGSGTADEPVDQAGFAWIAAQQLGRAKLGRDVYEHPGQAGGRVSVEVGHGATTFRIRGMSTHVDQLIQGTANWMSKGKYDAEKLYDFRESTKRQLGRRVVARRRATARAFLAALFGAEHPYARVGVPTSKSLDRIRVQELREYRDAHFVASNATLIVTGRFDIDLVEAHVRRTFRSWKKGRRNARPQVDAPSGGARFATVEDDGGEIVRVRLAFPTQTSFDGRYAERLVVAEMLNSRMSVVREGLGASYGMHAGFLPGDGPGYFEVYGSVDRLRLGEALAEITRGLEQLRSGKGFDVDFVYARRRVAQRLIGSLTSIEGANRQLTFIAEHRLSAEFLADLVQGVAKVRPDDVRGLIRTALSVDAQVVVCYGAVDAIRSAYESLGVSEVEVLE
jgi:zinc protease